MSIFLRSRKGFTLIELLASIAVILILAAIAMISIQKFLDSSRSAKEASNLRQLWSTVLMYASDHGGYLPANQGFAANTWQHRLVRWHKGLTVGETSALFQQYQSRKPTGFLEIFNSPLNPTDNNMAFGSGGWPQASNPDTGQLETTEVFGRPLASIDDPASSIALAPYYGGNKSLIGHSWQRPSGLPDVFPDDGDDYVTCAFVDGSVRRISRESIEEGRIRLSYPRSPHRN